MATTDVKGVPPKIGGPSLHAAFTGTASDHTIPDLAFPAKRPKFLMLSGAADCLYIPMQAGETPAKTTFAMYVGAGGAMVVDVTGFDTLRIADIAAATGALILTPLANEGSDEV